MPKVIHFDIPAKDPKKTMDFYTKVFEWQYEKWDGPTDYWFIKNGDSDEEEEPGINGAIGRKDSPEETIVNTIGVKSIDKYITRITENGGTLIGEKHPIPGVGYLVYFKDLDGNLFGLMEDDPNA